MKILIYCGHPAQYLFFRETIKNIISENIEVKVLIKSKDILEELVINDGIKYENIQVKERKNSVFSMAISLLLRNVKLFRVVRKVKPDLLIGTDPSIAQIGFLLRINRITVLEDDYKVIKKLAKLTYPFTQTILCPEVCDVSKWNNKKVGYNGYMKMAYLHPNYFKPNINIIKKYKLPDKFVLIRLSSLKAHHDVGIKGIDNRLLDSIIEVFEKENYNVLISSEKIADNKYEKMILKINPNDIHQVLYHSSFLVCDSQSMTVESCILGTPSVRISSFSGQISVLEELERKYNLTKGIQPSNSKEILNLITSLLEENELQKQFQERRDILINDKIDVTKFLIWFITKYPLSRDVMLSNPDYQNNFNTNFKTM
jgi:predicted glycosyltransferase